MFPVLDLYYADPAQPLTTAGEELDYLHHDLSVRGLVWAGDWLTFYQWPNGLRWYNALTNGVVGSKWVLGREFESHHPPQ